MIVTPTEAEKLWCPFVRIWTHQGPYGPADVWHYTTRDVWHYTTRGESMDPRQVCCLGPRCMAWRWFEAESESDGDKRRGFCGLAWRQ